MILSIGRIKKLLIWVVAIGMITFTAASLGGFDSAKSQTKVDRTNAMQVTKPIAPDPVMQVTTPDFFTEYRLEREKVRSERSDLLRDIIKTARTDDMRHKAQETVLKLSLDKQRESEMENLIKARGFADALVFVRDSSVNAVVKSTSLSKEEVLQVADAISRVTGVRHEDISISAKP